MINKKLLSFDRAALRYVGANVAFQWLGLMCNIIFVRAVARLVGAAFAGGLTAAAVVEQRHRAQRGYGLRRFAKAGRHEPEGRRKQRPDD